MSMRRLWMAAAVIAAAACEEERQFPPVVLTPRDGSVRVDAADAGDGDGAALEDEAGIDAGEDLDAGLHEDARPNIPDAGRRDTGPADTGVPVSGCGMPQMSGVFDGRMNVAGRMRELIVAVPANYDPSRRYALIFAWHGQNWQNESFRMAHMDLESASGGDAIVVYPQALSLGGSLSWDLGANGMDVAFYDQMHDYFSSNFCIDSTRVFSFGRSYGAFFTNTLACVRRSELRGISAWAGNGPNGNCPGRLSAWVGHAQDDTTVRYTTATRDHYLRANGCNTAMPMPIMPAPCVTYAGCQGGTRVTWCPHATGGHSAPFDYGTRAWTFFDSL